MRVALVVAASACRCGAARSGPSPAFVIAASRFPSAPACALAGLPRSRQRPAEAERRHDEHQNSGELYGTVPGKVPMVHRRSLVFQGHFIIKRIVLHGRILRGFPFGNRFMVKRTRSARPL